MIYIFLTNQYLPKPGATGFCVHMVAKCLAARSFDVSVICYDDGDKEKVFDGVRVVKIPVSQDFQATGQGGRFQTLHLWWLKLLNIYRYPLKSISLAKQYAEEIGNLIKGEDDVKVIASYTPLEAVYGMYLAKKKYPQLKCIYYSTDTLSNEKGNSGFLPLRYREWQGRRWEKILFSVCDKILIMECHQKHYQDSFFESFQHKIAIVNFPLLSPAAFIQDKSEMTGIPVIVFAGTLYKKLRNPQFACDLFTSISRSQNIKVVFMGSGDCDDILDQTRKNMGGSFEYLGMQPHQVADKNIKEADYLLSIGNAESAMAPSKIYEYMSTGKPIIHFYTYEKDPCIVPFKDYGNALIIREGDKDAEKRLQSFLTSRTVLPFLEVAKKFPLSVPDYTADVIQNV